VARLYQKFGTLVPVSGGVVVARFVPELLSLTLVVSGVIGLNIAGGGC